MTDTVVSIVAPVAETPNTATEPTDKPEVVELAPTDSGSEEVAGESEAKPEKTAEQKELERLRRMLTKRDRTQGKMHQELQALRQQQEQARQANPESPAPDTPHGADPYKLADEIATIREVTNKSNAVAKDGQTRFDDFNASLTSVVEEVGELFDKRGLPTPVGEAILDSKDPAALIDFLGSNPDIAADLEGLSPTKLGRKFAEIEAQMKTAPVKPVSKASEPISPIRGGAGNVVKTLENMSMAEYKAARAKQGARWVR